MRTRTVQHTFSASFIVLITCSITFTAFAQSPSDTIFYRFTDGRLSMYETHWSDGKKTYQIFSWKGEPIYKVENAHQSFTIFTTFTFHDNGSVKTAHTKTNPGSSLYMYESLIRFDKDNTPLSMQNGKWPTASVENNMRETYLWHTDKKKWIKQEVVTCAPVPSVY